jgi:hypothetical protein
MDGLNLFILTTKSALDAWQNAIAIILRILLNAENNKKWCFFGGSSSL